MVSQVYLVRHGIAVPHGTPGIPEDQRPLTPEGEKEVRKVAKGLRRLKVDPGRIVTSPLPRAFRTAEIIADVLDRAQAVESADALRAGNGAASIRDWIHSQPSGSLLLVGHDPAFSELVGLLVTGELTVPLCELDKAGVAALGTGDSGALVIEWIATPRMLRKLG
jgi:phosphohistidine phosphatase